MFPSRAYSEWWKKCISLYPIGKARCPDHEHYTNCCQHFQLRISDYCVRGPFAVDSQCTPFLLTTTFMLMVHLWMVHMSFAYNIGDVSPFSGCLKSNHLHQSLLWAHVLQKNTPQRCFLHQTHVKYLQRRRSSKHKPLVTLTHGYTTCNIDSGFLKKDPVQIVFVWKRAHLVTIEPGDLHRWGHRTCQCAFLLTTKRYFSMQSLWKTTTKVHLAQANTHIAMWATEIAKSALSLRGTTLPKYTLSTVPHPCAAQSFVHSLQLHAHRMMPYMILYMLRVWDLCVTVAHRHEAHHHRWRSHELQTHTHTHTTQWNEYRERGVTSVID